MRKQHPSAPRDFEPVAAWMHFRCAALARTAQTGEATGGVVVGRGKHGFGNVFLDGCALAQHARNRWPLPTHPWVHLCRAFRSYGNVYFKSDPILAHRVKAGVTEFLMPWTDIDPNTGKKYEPTWEPEENVTPDMVQAYRKKAFALKPHFTDGPVDISPLLWKVRSTIARAVTLGRTACRAHIHAIPLDALSLWALAVPFLNMLAAAVSTTCARRRARSTTTSAATPMWTASWS